MVTTDTTQTITAAKTLQGANLWSETTDANCIAYGYNTKWSIRCVNGKLDNFNNTNSGALRIQDGSGTYALALDGPTGGGNGICLYPFGGYYKADLGKNTFR